MCRYIFSFHVCIYIYCIRIEQKCLYNIKTFVCNHFALWSLNNLYLYTNSIVNLFNFYLKHCGDVLGIQTIIMKLFSSIHENSTPKYLPAKFPSKSENTVKYIYFLYTISIYIRILVKYFLDFTPFTLFKV